MSPDLCLNPDKKDMLFYRGYPNQTRQDEISIKSPKASEMLEEAAGQTGTTVEGVLLSLKEGKTIEY